MGVGAGVPASVHPELEGVASIILVLYGVAALPPGQGGEQRHQQQGPALQHHWAAYTLHWAGEDQADNADNAIVTVIVSVRC